MNGSLELTEGLVAVTGGAEGLFWADAAVVGDLAGFEFPLKEARVVIEPRPADRRAALMLSVSLTPNSMRELAVLLATKGGMPCFNEREWRTIRDSIDRDLIAGGSALNPSAQLRLVEASNAIAKAYGIGVSS